MQGVTVASLVCLGVSLAAANMEYLEFTHHPGIYLEELGKASLTQDDWKLVLFYNLENYWHEWKSIRSVMDRAHQICAGHSDQSANHTRATWFPDKEWPCEALLQPLQVMIDGMQDRNAMLQEPKRTRRAPLEFIGTFMSETFGVLDQRSARQYEAVINDLQRGLVHVSDLTRQQTHIVDMTVNLVRKQQEQTKTQYHQLHGEISSLTSHAEFVDTMLQLTTQITIFKEMQEAVIDVMIDLHQGHINTRLITPSQLQNQLNKLESWLPRHLRIPRYQQHWVQFYKNLRVTARVMNQRLIFELRIPLLDPEEYRIYKVYPVPTVHGDRMVSLQPTSPFILINQQQTWYYQMQYLEFRECQEWEDEQHVCKREHAVFNTHEEGRPCEISLLLHEELELQKCTVQSTNKRTSISPLSQANTWIMALAQTETVNVMCNGTVERAAIQGSGILSLSPDCKLMGKDYLLVSQKIYVSEQNAYFLPSFNITQKLRKSVGTLDSEDLDPEMEEILSAVRVLQQEETWYQFNVHDLSHYSSSGITIVLLVLFAIAWWKRRHISKLLYLATRQPASNTQTRMQTTTKRSIRRRISL